MTTEPIPIRAGVEPALDVEREMRDYCWQKIREYTEAYGPPSEIALVLLGKNEVDAMCLAHSWSPSDTGTRLRTCAAASALLLKRSLGL